MEPHITTRNSSGDEIASVNFLTDDIVHAVENTIDSYLNSATDLRGCVWTHCRFTKVSEITQCNGHYAVQGHRFWYQSKSYIPRRRYIAENFNRLSRVHQCYRRQTDRQTTDRRTCDDIIANVNVSSRSLIKTRNSSGDEIANVNFLCDDIVHALKIQQTLA